MWWNVLIFQLTEKCFYFILLGLYDSLKAVSAHNRSNWPLKFPSAYFDFILCIFSELICCVPHYYRMSAVMSATNRRRASARTDGFIFRVSGIRKGFQDGTKWTLSHFRDVKKTSFTSWHGCSSDVHSYTVHHESYLFQYFALERVLSAEMKASAEWFHPQPGEHYGNGLFLSQNSHPHTRPNCILMNLLTFIAMDVWWPLAWLSPWRYKIQSN